MNTLIRFASNMSVRRRTAFTLIVALAAFMPAQQARAQQDETAAPQAEEDDSWKRKSLRQLRNEFREAEKSFYDTFNSVNSADEFDISCKNRKPLGSRRSERTCQAKFLWEYEGDLAKASARAITTNGVSSMQGDQATRIEDKQVRLRNEMSSLIAEVPAVKQAFAELARTKRHYEAKDAER